MTHAAPSMTQAALSAIEDALPQLPRDGGGPVFKAPWEAQAFAITLALHEKGLFTWNEWAHALAEAIADARRRGDPDDGDTYYQHWLTALERIAARKGLLSAARLAERRGEWQAAARRTPHGRPVEL
jgi:nitrile hydratase accessory protein